MNKLNLKDKVFGRLIVHEPVGKYYTYVIWRCECSKQLGGCGNFIDVPTQRLRNGHTKSCGCLNRELAAGRAVFVGQKTDWKLMDEIIELRKLGFTHKVIAKLVKRCSKTVSKYLARSGIK